MSSQTRSEAPTAPTHAQTSTHASAPEVRTPEKPLPDFTGKYHFVFSKEGEKVTDQAVAVDKIETQSSIFAKADPDFRRRLDQALINHDPPTYRASYNRKLWMTG